MVDIGMKAEKEKINDAMVVKMHDEYEEMLNLVVSMVRCRQYSILELIDAALSMAKAPLRVISETGVYNFRSVDSAGGD